MKPASDIIKVKASIKGMVATGSDSYCVGVTECFI
jgi:hypothetical protein